MNFLRTLILEAISKIPVGLFLRLDRSYFVAFLAQTPSGYGLQKAPRLRDQYWKKPQNLFSRGLLILSLVGILNPLQLFAQRGKDGAGNIAAANVVVNAYTALSANATAGATTINVASSTLNTNFGSPLAAGDLIMIIQMQGVTLSARDSGAQYFDPFPFPRDSSWGMINNYGSCGRWEFGEVYSVPNGTSITLDCPLTYSYSATARTQVIRVPRYSTLNVTGSITCTTWGGTVGGVCAIEVETTTTITGSINVTGMGFRGGANLDNYSAYGANEYASKNNSYGGEKGEGVAGYQADYNIYGGRYCKAAGANAGGGGNSHNCGGGGGANAGDTSLWTGHGNPDNSTGGWPAAWNLQWAGFSASTSSGGGQGGYAFSNSLQNPTTVPPGNAAWVGDNRNPYGGHGGRPLDYNTGRLFLGGGGGSADQDNSEGGAGANGGGMIYLMNYGTVSIPGQIIANGNIGASTTGSDRDGAGGGGAGGTIVVNSVGAITGVGSISANGGKGGDQMVITTQAEGPGGGGGGGYIAISNGAPTRTTAGGVNGISNSTAMALFRPNGATIGGAGINNAAVTNFTFNAANQTICSGQSATLTAGIVTGVLPGGTAYIWYDALVAGNVIGNGATYVTPVLGVGTYTYYVGTCPGTYHLPVIVTVTNSPAITVSPNTTICSGGSATLNASGASSYTWSPTTGLSNPNISNPVANPASTTTYVVSATTPCGIATGTVVVDVNSSITANITGNTTICAGGSATLSTSGGGTYSWSTGASTSSISVSPTTNTTYSVDVVNGSCAASASVTVVVSSGITATISPGNTTLCPGSQTTLTASGGSNYSWSTTETTATINVSPTATTTYTVNVTSGSCSSAASVTLTISNSLATTINGPTNICTGGSATLTATGGGNYSWSTTETTAAITVTPTGSTTYSVLVSAGTCTATASITVNVGANITAGITGTDTICGGTSTTLTANGGGNYAWNTGASTGSISVTPAASSSTTYTVIASSGSCADTTTFTLTALPAVLASVTGNNIICQGDASTLAASTNNPANNTYLWNTGSTAIAIIVSPSANTTYTVVGYSGACPDTATITVTVTPIASLTVSPNTTVCAGASVILSAQGGSNYTWSNGASTSSATVSPTSNITYTVIAGVGACSDTDSVSVSVLPSPTVAVTASSVTICGGDAVTLNASGGTTYAWSNSAITSSTTVNPLTTTTYTVIAISGSCNDTGTVTVNVSPPPVASITGNTNICQGVTATITAAPPGATYLWSTGETTATINPPASGNYSVIVSVGSCKDTAYITTVIAPNPTASAFSDTTIISGHSANLSASGGTNYLWDNSMNGANITVTPNSTTVYCVTVTDANGCTDTACVTVRVEECPKVFYLPNAFSPNGDTENDELQIYYGLPACIKEFNLVLYNRWGEIIYKTSDPLFKWDGSYKGWILGTQTGGTQVYTYYMNVEFLDGTRIGQQGNISLVR